MDREIDLTKGTPWQLLLRFSLPLMVGNIFQQLYTVVDTAVVGKVLGVDALAALGAVDWLYWLVLSAIQGFAQGFCILIAQQFGARENKGLRRTAANSILLAFICVLALTAAGELIAGPVVGLLRTPERIRPMAMLYLRILVGGSPVVMAYNLSAAMLRATGDSRTPLMAMVAASVSNIVLDLLFVVGLRWGVAGAAAATLIAQCLSAAYCVRRLRRTETFQLSQDDWSISASLFGRLLGLGSPMALQNAIIAVGGMILQSIVNGFGVAFIAGYTATNKLYGLLEIAAVSYGYAMSTYAGQNLGAGKVWRISDGVRAGLGIAAATSVTIAAVMLLCGRWILGWFMQEDAAESAEALSVAYRYLSIMSVCLPVLYLLHITRSCIQGLGNTVLPMVSGVAELFMRTGGALLLPAHIGETGIMLAEVLAWVGADLILVPSCVLLIHTRAADGERPEIAGKTDAQRERARSKKS